MNSDNKLIAFWVILFLGALVSLTNLFAPIHELGHVLYALAVGEEGSIKDWNHANVTMNVSHAIAGWHFEIAVFCIAGWLVGACAENNRWAGAFFIGHAVGAMPRVYNSSDVQWYAREVCRIYGLKETQINDIVLRIQGRWFCIMLFWLLITVWIVVRWHKRRKS
jgi:hypothetical protein